MIANCVKAIFDKDYMKKKPESKFEDIELLEEGSDTLDNEIRKSDLYSNLTGKFEESKDKRSSGRDCR